MRSDHLLRGPGNRLAISSHCLDAIHFPVAAQASPGPTSWDVEVAQPVSTGARRVKYQPTGMHIAVRFHHLTLSEAQGDCHIASGRHAEGSEQYWASRRESRASRETTGGRASIRSDPLSADAWLRSPRTSNVTRALRPTRSGRNSRPRPRSTHRLNGAASRGGSARLRRIRAASGIGQSHRATFNVDATSPPALQYRNAPGAQPIRQRQCRQPLTPIAALATAAPNPTFRRAQGTTPLEKYQSPAQSTQCAPPPDARYAASARHQIQQPAPAHAAALRRCRASSRLNMAKHRLGSIPTPTASPSSVNRTSRPVWRAHQPFERGAMLRHTGERKFVSEKDETEDGAHAWTRLSRANPAASSCLAQERQNWEPVSILLHWRGSVPGQGLLPRRARVLTRRQKRGFWWLFPPGPWRPAIGAWVLKASMSNQISTTSY